MDIREGTDDSLLTAISAAPRALVFLTVPWSGYERDARRAFQSAAQKMALEHPDIGVELFALDEDAEICQAWLASLQFPRIKSGYRHSGYPAGAGSIFWMEYGRVVSTVGSAAALEAGDITDRSLSLWR
jgi:hypothetical protein